MCGISRSNGLTFRLAFNRSLGPRVHVFDGFNELVLNPTSLRIMHGRATPEVRCAAVRWVATHRHEILFQGQLLERRRLARAAR